MRGHLSRAQEPALEGFRRLLSRKLTLLSYAVTWVSTMGAFIVIPNIAAFVQGNLGYPREGLSWLYGIGGLVSFATLRPIGRLVDRVGPFRVGSSGALLLTIVTWVGFVWADPRVPVLAIFVLFMLCNGLRNVAYNTLTSRVPTPDERARFMSLQSMIQHLGSASGAFLSSQLLSQTDDGRLVHMDRVAYTSIGLLLALPVLLYWVERGVKRSEAETKPLALAPAAAE